MSYNRKLIPRSVGIKSTQMNHKDLCVIAVDWLRRPSSRNGPGCNVALSEVASGTNGEIPDAIGWRPYAAGFGSVVVEVKVSRGDFLADIQKSHRQNPAKGMGSYRYFLTPQGMISVEELPPRWGLIEVNEKKRIKVLAGHVLDRHENLSTWAHEYNQAAEISVLALCLNRVGDPQKLQEWLRQSNTRAQKSAAECEALRLQNKALLLENYALQNPDASQVAKARRRQTFEVAGDAGAAAPVASVSSFS